MPAESEKKKSTQISPKQIIRTFLTKEGFDQTTFYYLKIPQRRIKLVYKKQKMNK